jgi:SAM-dependent methyltransferase
MRELGWDVAGNDFDANAVKVATNRGLNVAVGSLEDQKLPSASFDAVTLSHVIEHLPDPIGTMRECARILKPGGKVVLLTPNCASLSHRFFKQDWRGLEPPRHLHVFSLKSMDRMLAMTGFEQRSVRPFIVTSVIFESLQLRWGRTNANDTPRHRWLARLLIPLFKFVESCLIRWQPDVGDCIFASATKPGK